MRIKVLQWTYCILSCVVGILIGVHLQIYLENHSNHTLPTPPATPLIISATSPRTSRPDVNFKGRADLISLSVKSSNASNAEDFTSAAEKTCRNRVSATFRRMRDRAQLPKLLISLGLKGESVEVGVREGDYSKHIMRSWEGKLHHMVDPWAHQDNNLYKDISNRNQAHQNRLYNKLKTFMQQTYPNRSELHRGYSADVAKTFANASLDFVYLDARHDYEGVKEDLHAWWDKLSVGGVYAGHDFVPDGMINAGAFGVQKAVHEFARAKEKEFMSISIKRPNGARLEPQRVDGGWTTWYIIK